MKYDDQVLSKKFYNSAVESYRAYVWGSGKDGRCGNGSESNERVANPVNSQHKFI